MYNNVITERELDGFLFLPNGSQIIYNSTKILNLKNKKKIDLLNIAVYPFFDKILVCKDFEGNKVILNNDLEIIKTFNSGKDGFISEFFENSFLHNYYKNQNYDLPFIGIFDIETQSNVWEVQTSFQNYLIHDDMIFISGRDLKVKLYYSNSEKSKWHFDLSQFGNWKNFENKDRDYEVEQFVGIANNCLYVLLSNFKLIALNVENGHLVQQLNLGEQFALEDRNWLSNSSKIHLDEVNNRMIWLTSATFLHIDLETFKANLIKDYFNVPLENLWRFKRSNFQEQQLLFTAQNGREGGDPDIIGIMNPDTGEILWQYQITETQGLYEEPQLANNKLYVKSLDDILYIFEKE